MYLIGNRNNANPLQTANNVIKVVVIGEPGCGKTRFIQAYYDHHVTGFIYGDQGGAIVYPCEFAGDVERRRAFIYEIPGDPDFLPEQRIPHYERADVIVFMYAIDDPESYQMLTVRWIEETTDIINSRNIPAVFIGTKQDLRDDEQVIQRLALENQSPVTVQEGFALLNTFGNATIMECSANDLDRVETVLNTIFAIVVDNE